MHGLEDAAGAEKERQKACYLCSGVIVRGGQEQWAEVISATYRSRVCATENLPPRTGWQVVHSRPRRVAVEVESATDHRVGRRCGCECLAPGGQEGVAHSLGHWWPPSKED